MIAFLETWVACPLLAGIDLGLLVWVRYLRRQLDRRHRRWVEFTVLAEYDPRLEQGHGGYVMALHVERHGTVMRLTEGQVAKLRVEA